MSHDGIRIPVEEIVKRLALHDQWPPVVIDGAQDFCHTPGTLNTEFCDLYVAGCHKWLGAYHPMGLAFYGRRRSTPIVETVLTEMLQDGDLDDPLLRFSSQLENDSLNSTTETVNLASLFCCFGAACDRLKADRFGFNQRVHNGELVLNKAQNSDWCPHLPDVGFRSAVVLLESRRPSVRQTDPQDLRESFEARGISLSAYAGGLVRLSMPDQPIDTDNLERIETAFAAVA